MSMNQCKHMVETIWIRHDFSNPSANIKYAPGIPSIGSIHRGSMILVIIFGICMDMSFCNIGTVMIQKSYEHMHPHFECLKHAKTYVEPRRNMLHSIKGP